MRFQVQKQLGLGFQLSATFALNFQPTLRIIDPKCARPLPTSCDSLGTPSGEGGKGDLATMLRAGSSADWASYTRTRRTLVHGGAEVQPHPTSLLPTTLRCDSEGLPETLAP